MTQLPVANHHLRQPAFWLPALFVLFGFLYAVVTPLFEASDELWHYPMVQHLSRGGALPVQDPGNVGPWRQEASQPPLYYYLMGWATAWIDTGDMPQVRWLNPHVDNGIITPDGNINLAIHTSAEKWPWRGAALAVRLIRLLSVLMGAGAVFFTYLLAGEFFDDEPSRLAAAGLVAFTPMFAFISGAVNNDNLASLLSAAILFILVRLSNQQSVISHRQSFILGILLGLAALTKQSALGLYPLAGITLLVSLLRRISQPELRNLQSAIRNHSSFFILHSSFVFLPALIIPSWWYYRNLVLYGDLLGWSAFIAVLGKRAAPASLAQLWGERESFTRSYWGLFGGVNVPMSDWVYTALNTIALAALLGLAAFFLRQLASLLRAVPTSTSRFSLRRLTPVLPYAILFAHLALILYGLVTWATVTWSSQGRLVFSGISAIAVLLVLGLRMIIPARIRPFALGAIVLFMAAVTAASPFAFIAPAYADPPRLADSEIAAIPHRAEVDFGSINFPPEMRLLGYALESDSVKPGSAMRLTLYWESLAVMDRDWSVFVHVVDENGIVVAQRDTYPGLGLMPTRKLAAGQTLADAYAINVPPTTYSPGSAKIEIGLYDYNTGDRLIVVTEGLPDSGRDALTLSPLVIAANPGDAPNPQSLNFGGQVELIGYDMDRRTLHLSNSDSLTLTLYWRGIRQMTTNYSVFAHVRGAGESLWAQSDSWPQDGAAPTTTWAVGQVVAETRTLAIKPDIAPGVYDVEVGLYDENGIRLQLVLPDGRLTDNFVYLAKIRILP